MTEPRLTSTYKWLAVGVFVGVVLAELLSRRIPPFLAWLLGGSLIGVMPAGSERPRRPAQIALAALATGVVAALANWLVARLAP